MLTIWSQPIPASRSAIARASAASGRNGAVRASTTTKSLPRPFILRKGRLIGAYIGDKAARGTAYRRIGRRRAPLGGE